MSRPQEQTPRPLASDIGVNGRFRMPRMMPQWMRTTEAGRCGPAPPPPPATPGSSRKVPPNISPEPDYEVIEFPTQQYMNATLNPAPAPKKNDGRHCDLCGSSEPGVRCLNCNGQVFCASCDDMYHRHPKRQTHIRKTIAGVGQENIRPPLPPKGVSSPPVPPPRRNKVSSRNDNIGGMLNRNAMSPINERAATMQRMTTRALPAVPSNQFNTMGRQDMGRQEMERQDMRRQEMARQEMGRREMESQAMSRQQMGRQEMGPQQIGRQEMVPQRMGRQDMETQQMGRQDMRRQEMGQQDMNREDKDLQEEEQEMPISKQQLTKESVANSALQQRYKRHQEMMRGTAPDLSQDFSNMTVQTNQLNHKNQIPMEEPNNNWRNDKWAPLPQRKFSNISEQNAFKNNAQFEDPGLANDFDQPMASAPSPQRSLKRGAMSASVFDLNSSGVQPPHSHGVHQHMAQQRLSPMIQAQSMAQLGCMNCQHQMMAPGPVSPEWMPWAGRYGSNMSLNLPAEGYPQPPIWMGPWGPMPMYPGAMLPPQHNGMNRAATMSRTHSRINSRAASPTASIRSRRSRASRRNVEPEDISDEEDDRRSSARRASIRSDRRKLSQSSSDFPKESVARPANIHREVRSSPTPERKQYNNRRTSDTSEGKSSSHMSPEIQRPKSRSSVVREMVQTSTSPPITSSDIDSDRRSVPKEDVVNVADVLETPPPPTPQHAWVCEYCTFVNNAGTRVCDVCCKTPTAPPAPTKAAPATTSPSKTISKPTEKKPTGRKLSSSESCTNEYSDSDAQKIFRQKSLHKEAPKASPESDSNEESLSKSQVAKGESDGAKSFKSSKKDLRALSPFETVRTIEEDSPKVSRISESNVVIRVKNVNRNQSQKVSTGCGPSPPKEVEPAKPEPARETVVESSRPKTPLSDTGRRETMSTGTSPLPQSLSTQTYDVIQEKAPSEASTKDDDTSHDTKSTTGTGRSKRFNKPMKRSNSLHNSRVKDVDQWTSSHKSDRSISRLSYSSDTHSIPTTPPRDESPSPYTRYNSFPQGEPKHLGHMGPLRSRSNSLLPTNFAMGMGAPSSYRSTMDLRKPDLYRDREEQWRNNFVDPYMYNQMNDYGYPGDVPPRDASQHNFMMEQLIHRRQSDVMKSQGMELVKLLREAELSNFSAEELQIAMTSGGTQNPITWLKDNWSTMVETVLTVATNYGRESKDNNVGTISHLEARDALRKHKGSVWQAVTECVEQRQKKYTELQTRGKFTREDVLTCLTAHHGDMEAAFLELSKTQLKPFLMRIWGPPSGADNESGNSAVLGREQEGVATHLPTRALEEDVGLSGPNSLLEYISAHADQATLAHEATVEAARSVSSVNTKGMSPEASLAASIQVPDTRSSFNQVSQPNESNSSYNLSPQLQLLASLKELLLNANDSKAQTVLKDIGNIFNSLEQSSKVESASPVRESESNNTKLISYNNNIKTNKISPSKEVQQINLQADGNNSSTSSHGNASSPSSRISPVWIEPSGRHWLDEYVASDAETPETNQSLQNNIEKRKTNESIESDNDSSNSPDNQGDDNSHQVRHQILVENENVNINIPIENQTVQPIVADKLVETASRVTIDHSNKNQQDIKLATKCTKKSKNNVQSTQRTPVASSTLVTTNSLATSSALATSSLTSSSGSTSISPTTSSSLATSSPLVTPSSLTTSSSAATSVSLATSSYMETSRPLATSRSSEIKLKDSLAENLNKIIPPLKQSSKTPPINDVTDSINVDSTKKSQPLSNFMEDTHRLIQQMRDEIQSDIATYTETSDDESSGDDDMDGHSSASSAMPNSSAHEHYSDEEDDITSEGGEEEESGTEEGEEEEEEEEEEDNQSENGHEDAVTGVINNTILGQDNHEINNNKVHDYTSDEYDKYEEAVDKHSEAENDYFNELEHAPHSDDKLQVFDDLIENLHTQAESIKDNSFERSKTPLKNIVPEENVSDISGSHNSDSVTDTVPSSSTIPAKHINDEISNNIVFTLDRKRTPSPHNLVHKIENEQPNYSIQEVNNKMSSPPSASEAREPKSVEPIPQESTIVHELTDNTITINSKTLVNIAPALESHTSTPISDGLVNGWKQQSEASTSSSNSNVLTTQQPKQVKNKHVLKEQTVPQLQESTNGIARLETNNNMESKVLIQRENTEAVALIQSNNIEEPSTTQSNIEEPSAANQNIEEPSAAQPNIEEPSAAQPNIEEPTATQSNIEEPSATQPNIEEPSATQLNIEGLSATQSDIEEPLVTQLNFEDTHARIETNLEGISTNARIIDEEETHIKNSTNISNNESSAEGVTHNSTSNIDAANINIETLHKISETVNINNDNLNIPFIEDVNVDIPPQDVNIHKTTSAISNSNATATATHSFINDNSTVAIKSVDDGDSQNDKNESKKKPNTIKKSFVSQIPKLEKSANVKPVPKVPLKMISNKNNTAPQAEANLPFGNNVQSGIVKKLQQGLFNKVNVTIGKPGPKIPIPVTPKRIFGSPAGSKKISNQDLSNSNVKKDTDKPKKKPFFAETCLSDDYFTDEDVKPARVNISQKPRLSIIKNEEEKERISTAHVLFVNKKCIDISAIHLKEDSPERQIRMLMAEGIVPSWEQAEVALELVSMKFGKTMSLMAANECTTLEAALAYLQQECELCTGKYPMEEMVSMLKCTHRCCKECAKNYFTVQITNQNILDCTCPYCKHPELRKLDEDDVLEYFRNLYILLKSLLDENVHEIFQIKLRDRALRQDPNFKWCVVCPSGFIANPRQKRLVCSECQSVTCALCRRPWEAQHDGISCEKFAEWKESNDPDTQVAGVKKHLDDHGIDCPKCKFRFALSRGGCMHFTCSQCKYEFCCGCDKPFMMGAMCGLSPYCAKLGLHSHHPRNCLFYLRDKEPRELKTLLQLHNIEFCVDPPETAEGNAATRCPVQLQRETESGMVDSVCNSEVVRQQGGLCQVHYVEYLVNLLKNVDPLPIMDLSEMVAELRRRGIPLPERGPWDDDPIYTEMCAKIIKEQIPLE